MLNSATHVTNATTYRKLPYDTLNDFVALSPVAQMPTIMAEAGVPGIVVRDWQGVLAPRGTPKQVIDKLHDEITRILRHPDDRERLAGMGLEIIASTPEEFRSAVISEIQRWAKVVKAANIKAE